MAANTFQYQPLHRDIEEIRILLVQPAWSPDAQIQCEIRHASLFSNPQFEALSYTWGGEQNQQLITLAGQPFPVRENLLAALKRLRRSMTARAVWIDAICIDQNNDEEKGFQLPLMTKLYSQAQQVCVWLGEASTLSSVGIKSFTSGWSEIGLNVSSSKLLRNYAVMDWRDGLKSSEAMQRQADLSREFQLGEVRELLSRPWWTRVWIMQEAIVARKLVFMCGGESAPWDSVDNFIKRAVSEKGAVTAFGIVMNAEFSLLNASHALISDLRRRWREGQYDISVYELLFEFRQLDCTKPKDRIYGFMGMVERSLGFRPKVDLQASTRDVFLNFASAVIDHTRTLDILNCGRERRGAATTTLPSCAYSIMDQGKYHDPLCVVLDGPGKTPRKAWVRLPPGWERVTTGKTSYYYDWNNRIQQPHSPYANMGPQMPQVVAKQRVLPKGWEKTWTNLGTTDVKFRPIELRRRKVNPMVAELSNLPTWVPNWCHHSPWDPAPLLDWSANHPRYWAGGTMSSTYKPNVTSPAELNLTGIHFDTIETLAEPWHPTTQVPPVSRKDIAVLQAWEHLAMSPVQNCPYKSTHGRKTATWRTHIGDYAGNGAVPASDWRLIECWYDRIGWAKTLPDLDALAGKSIMRTAVMQGDVRNMDDAMFSHWLDLDKDGEEMSLNMRGVLSVSKMYGTYVKRIHRVCAHRALFVTRKGYIGLAPWNAKVGDAVFVLEGGKTPFLLRQYAAGGAHAFVGESYLYGIMAGEAWNMGLPDQQVTLL